MKKILTILASLLVMVTVSAQSAKNHVAFNGLVVTADNKPVGKAKIYVSNPRDYTLSDKRGRFGLTDVMPTDTLTVIIKKTTYRIPVEGRRSMVILVDDITLTQPVVNEDEKLVSWGFGYVPRREYTGVSNFISGEDLRRSGYRTILTALQGRVPGLNISNTGQFGETADVNIRGTRSFRDSGTPVYVLNNTVVQSFEGISLSDVDYVEVLKDASIYGAGGANGAIIVHTK